MSEPDRTDEGEFASVVQPRDVLDAFEAVPGPVVTASDVAERLDCSSETARWNLDALREDGLVENRTAGRTKVRWRTSAGTGKIDASDPFWHVAPAEAAGPTDVSEAVDAHLAGIERGENSNEE